MSRVHKANVWSVRVYEQSVNACVPKTTAFLSIIIFYRGSLSDMTRNFDPLPGPVMCRFTKQVFEGLAYIHSQVWACGTDCVVCVYMHVCCDFVFVFMGV